MATYDTLQTPTAAEDARYAAVREGRSPNVAGLANPNNRTPGGMAASSNSYGPGTTFTRTSPNVQRYREEAQRAESAIDYENRINPYSVMNQALNMEQQRKERERAAQQRRNQATPQYSGPQTASQNPYGDPLGTQQPQRKYIDRITGNSDRVWDRMEGKYNGEYDMLPVPVAPQPQNSWGDQASLEQQQAYDRARYEEEMRRRNVNRFQNIYLHPFESKFIPGFSANFQN